MIFSQLSNLKKYKEIPYLKEIDLFLAQHNLLQLPVGEINILDEHLFVHIYHYFSDKEDPVNFESHRVYTDLHLIMRGREKIQIASDTQPSPLAGYDEKEDVQFFHAPSDVSEIIVGTKEFVVFFAGELHRPKSFNRNVHDPITKFVFKIKSK